MRHRLRTILIWATVSQVVMWTAGQVISRRLSKGDDSSDEFTVAAILGGKQFRSRAGNLRSGSAIASLGGLELDLRDAILDPAGASLDLDVTMGGVQVLVPADWAVETVTRAVAGGIETKLTPPGQLPGDSPRLRINAVARMGGALVTSAP